MLFCMEEFTRSAGLLRKGWEQFMMPRALYEWTKPGVSWEAFADQLHLGSCDWHDLFEDLVSIGLMTRVGNDAFLLSDRGSSLSMNLLKRRRSCLISTFREEGSGSDWILSARDAFENGNLEGEDFTGVMDPFGLPDPSRLKPQCLRGFPWEKWMSSSWVRISALMTFSWSHLQQLWDLGLRPGNRLKWVDADDSRVRFNLEGELIEVDRELAKCVLGVGYFSLNEESHLSRMSRLKVGDKAVISSFLQGLGGEMARHFHSIGLVPGVSILAGPQEPRSGFLNFYLPDQRVVRIAAEEAIKVIVEKRS